MAFKGPLLASHSRSLALICARLLQLWPTDCAQLIMMVMIIVIVVVIIIIIINYYYYHHLKVLEVPQMWIQMAFKAIQSRSLALICEAFATLTRWLCTEYIDPATIEPILASHLIPLGKGNIKVRPIGVGEVIRIIGKSVTKVTKQDILELSGLLQVCIEHKSGSEAAVHTMNSLFRQEGRCSAASGCLKRLQYNKPSRCRS